MRSAALFAAGVLAGVVLVKAGLAQDTGVRSVNHIGIVVSNYDASLNFYKNALGIREAYTIRNADGSVRLTYLQASRDTFVELIPAAPNQRAGVTHFGIEVGDIEAMVARLRSAGVRAADPDLTPAKAEFTRIADPDGVEIEVMEFGPEALQRKAMDAWR